MYSIPTSKPHIKFTKVIALDPGGTTGYCELLINYKAKTVTINKIGEFKTWSLVEDLISKMNPETDCLVYEGFALRIIEANLIPVEVIGVIRFLACKASICYYKQMPADVYARKGVKFIEDIWYTNVRAFNSHHLSAINHGILFCINHLFDKVNPTLNYDFNKLQKEFLRN